MWTAQECRCGTAGSLPANPLPSAPYRRRPANMDPGRRLPRRSGSFVENAWGGSGHLLSGPQFEKARGGEVAVEGKRLGDPLRSHKGEAGGVDERVLALVVLTEPQ
jgi:hypothetical protein